MVKKASWQSLILYYNLAPLVLEVYQPRKIITHLDQRRPYLVSKRRNGFLLSPITKQDKNQTEPREKESEPKKIKYWHQFALDLKCDCLKFASFVNLNTQILVPAGGNGKI